MVSSSDISGKNTITLGKHLKINRHFPTVRGGQCLLNLKASGMVGTEKQEITGDTTFKAGGRVDPWGQDAD